MRLVPLGTHSLRVRPWAPRRSGPSIIKVRWSTTVAAPSAQFQLGQKLQYGRDADPKLRGVGGGGTPLGQRKKNTYPPRSNRSVAHVGARTHQRRPGAHEQFHSPPHDDRQTRARPRLAQLHLLGAQDVGAGGDAARQVKGEAAGSLQPHAGLEWARENGPGRALL